MNGYEKRAFVAEVRISGGGDTEPTRIVGHAAVFDSLSEDLGGFREKIAPGAFAESIKTDDVRALFNHSPDIVLGRTKSGTLTLSEDSDGLLTDITPPDTQAARDIMTSIERGDIDQMSFGFRVKAGGQEWSEEGEEVIRTLTDVALFDVSPVTFPAYQETDVAVRSLAAYREDINARDQHIRAQAESRQRRLRLLQIWT